MSSSPLQLVRGDLRGFAGYSSARTESPGAAGGGTPGQPSIWLNANESAWDSPADQAGSVRRYPDPQPQRLRTALAELYGCRPEQLLAGRGSDEAIDLLVRAVCRPGGDAVVVTPPTFGMYAVSARLHGTHVLEVPLRDAAGGLDTDVEAVGTAAQAGGARIVFLCSPGNPSGTLVPLDEVRALARRLDGQSLVVVDEAYLEFAGTPSASTLTEELSNVLVLRTLSKAHALAGVRVGAVIGDPDLIAVLQRCQAPYPLPAPSVELALAALGEEALTVTAEQIAAAVQARRRLTTILQQSPAVTRVYPSAANFVLARFTDPQHLLTGLIEAGIVVRDMRDKPGLGDALRITVGTPDQLDAVRAVLHPTSSRAAPSMEATS